MKATQIFLTAGAALIAYNLFAKGNALQRLNFFPGAVDGTVRFQGINPIIRVGLTVQNTSNQKMVVRSFAGNVYSNNTLVGNVSSYSSLSIPARGETVYWVDLKLFPLGIVNNIIRAIQGSGVKQKLELDATANVDYYQVPVDITYNIG